MTHSSRVFKTLHAYHTRGLTFDSSSPNVMTSAALVTKLKTGMPEQAQGRLVAWPG